MGAQSRFFKAAIDRGEVGGMVKDAHHDIQTEAHGGMVTCPKCAHAFAYGGEVEKYERGSGDEDADDDRVVASNMEETTIDPDEERKRFAFALKGRR